MEAVAKTKYLKGSPQKARLVIDLVRGQNVSKALAILQYTNKRAAGPIAKCLRSAIANATYKAEQENIAIDPDDLWVKRCFVDMGPTKNRRRLRPAPQGRAYFERRHYCHITIELTSEPMEDAKPAFDPSMKKPIKAKQPKDSAEVVEKKAKAVAPEAEENVQEAVETPVAEEVKTEAAESAPESTETVESAPVEDKVETADMETTESKADETAEADVEAEVEEEADAPDKAESNDADEAADAETEEPADKQ